MARYQIQMEIGGEWECMDFEESDTGERLPVTYASPGEAHAELTDTFREMNAQGMEFNAADWRIRPV